jgi:tetratricopeptide (TPR) repeat protein
MIVKNEAETLPSCLASVRDVVDEMVVLDTGSTDGTPDIARSLGARVEFFDWCDDFAIARNHALTYVHSDWVLVLDADERLTEAIAPQLRQAIQQEDALVVNLIRHEIGATQSPYSLVSRLFRRHPAVQFARPYHAMIDDSVHQLMQQEPHWQIMNLPEIAILHDGYQAGAIAGRDKMNRARLTMERFLVANPGEPYVCSKLGALYVQMGRVEHGMELLERGLKSPSLDPPVSFELHYHLGIAYSRLNRINQAIDHYQTAIAQPLIPRLKLGAYNNLALLHQSQGEFDSAQALYEQALAIDPNFGFGHYNLAMLLKTQGAIPEAIAHYRQAIQASPEYAPAHQNLGVILLKIGDIDGCKAAFREAIALYYRQNNPQEAVRLRKGLQEIGLRF